MAGEVIGSVMNTRSCTSSSVIMAYWPSRGDLSSIDYSVRRNVGVVQFFCRNRANFQHHQSDKVSREHVFTFIRWKQKHPHEDWYGHSATVCLDMYEPLSETNLMPVQRISAVCARAIINVEIQGLTEPAFIASPIL